MRRAAAILALSLFAPPAFPADTAATPTALAPKAVAVDPVKDFGTVQPGPTIRHDFVIRNEGTAPLELVGAVPSCECTVTEFDRIIPPGGTGKVSASLDTRVLTGPSKGVIEVTTNDLANLTLTLTTQVNVHHLLLARPGYARWNMVQGEKEGTIGQTMWSQDGKEFEVLEVVAPGFIRTGFRPAQEAELRPGVDGSQWRLELTVDSWAPTGPIAGFVEVKTNHPAQPVMRLPVSGFVRPILHVTPPTGEFGSLQLETGKRAVFHVQNFATELIEVLGVDSTVTGLDVKLSSEEAGRSYRIEVLIPTTMAAGPFEGALRIRTDNSKVPLVEVPLSGTVEKPSSGSAR